MAKPKTDHKSSSGQQPTGPSTVPSNELSIAQVKPSQPPPSDVGLVDRFGQFSVALAGVSVALLRFVLAVGIPLFLFLYRQPLSSLVERVTHLDAFGVKIDIANTRTKIKSAFLISRAKYNGDNVSDQSLDAAIQFAIDRADIIDRSHILWINDVPQDDRALRRFLEDLGVRVTLAVSSAEAWALIDRFEFDLVVSDIHRSTDTNAPGVLDRPVDPLKFAERLAEISSGPIVGFYVADLKNHVNPAGSLWVENRPDGLIRRVVEALGSQRRSR